MSPPSDTPIRPKGPASADCSAKASYYNPSDSSLPSITMDSPEVTFCSVSKRVSPTTYLKILRGTQKEPLLNTSDYMSPALHNSSDAYQRLLRAQVIHGNELRYGRHLQQWHDKTAQKQSFIKFTDGLEFYASDFLHGLLKEKHKEEMERLWFDDTCRKDEYLDREYDGMARRGWFPGDWLKIQRDIVDEDMKAAAEHKMDRSFDSIETVQTNISSVFDDESEDEDTEDDEFDHLYSYDDEKQFQQSLNHSDSLSNSDTDCEEKDESSDENNDSDSLSKSDDDETPTNQPSALLASWCYKPGDDSDNDDESDMKEETSTPNSPSPPASLCLDSSAVIETESEVGEVELSFAHQIKQEFVNDLLSVRTQLKLHMAVKEESDAINAILYIRNKDRDHSEKEFEECLFSLREQIIDEGLSRVSEHLFRCNDHEVEFKGPLRDEVARMFGPFK